MRYHSEDSLSDFRPYLFPIFMQRYGKILRKKKYQECFYLGIAVHVFTVYIVF